jgi:crossover junction endodeoxyribonuclease RuvC
MLILGVDPGIAITGYGLLEQNGNRIKPLKYGVIRTSSDLMAAERLMAIHQKITDLVKEYKPEVMVVEELFFNKNTRTALTVGQARGVIMLVSAEQRIKFAEYTPLQVKMAVVGYGRAEKRQVQEMVRVLLGLKEIPKPDDAADALAIAICHAHSWRYSSQFKGV